MRLAGGRFPGGFAGARNAVQTNVSIGGRIVSAEAVIASTDMPGLDEVHVRVPADLRGAGIVNLSVNSDGRDSNPVTVNFLGDPTMNQLGLQMYQLRLVDRPDLIMVVQVPAGPEALERVSSLLARPGPGSRGSPGGTAPSPP